MNCEASDTIQFLADLLDAADCIDEQGLHPGFASPMSMRYISRDLKQR